MQSWEKHKLKDLVSFKTGKLDSNAAVNGGQYPFFTCAPETLSIDSYVFDTTAILLAGNNATGIFPIKFYSGKFNCYQRTYVIENVNAIECDLKFIYFALQMQLSFLQSLSIGAATKFLTKRLLDNLKLPLPDLSTQQKIAAILSAFDDLIENNLKRIKLLEEMAQITYEEWFVHLKFPGHETTPIDSETGLPKKWERKQIRSIGNVITGKTPSTENEDNFGKDIPFIKTPDMAGVPYVIKTEQYLSISGANSQKGKLLPKNSLIISCIGSAGAYALTAVTSQTNQQINAIVFNNEKYTFYMYSYAKHLKPLLEALGSNGATMTNVNKSKFEQITVVIPNDELLVKYHEQFKKNFESILMLLKQNQLLKEARDILLPRLMTGMIDVKQLPVAQLDIQYL